MLLTLFTVSAGAYVPEASTVEAAPAPATVIAQAPAPAAVPAMPAVVSPATALLAEGVEGLSPKVLAMALDAMACAKAKGVSGRNDLLTVIDYSLPSTEPRLWVLDLERGEVLFNELVAHGQGSGEKFATRFSNLNDSHQTSLGLFLTGGTYQGGNGYSMKLKGLEKGFNDRAETRYIVMHGAWYVSEDHARNQGRLGRSWGCPALSEEMAPRVIDTIKGGSFVYSYGGDQDWLQAASSNTCGGASAVTAAG
ncbi:MAG TPA: murein L,D-transpeptidase catalytic domain family protein [Thermoanaerobaculia bacterium]|nr:murein L,D-transpeptidase catalytic domain family protein [Thermoanaerobaculia bacterium]